MSHPHFKIGQKVKVVADAYHAAKGNCTGEVVATIDNGRYPICVRLDGEWKDGYEVWFAESELEKVS